MLRKGTLGVMSSPIKKSPGPGRGEYRTKSRGEVWTLLSLSPKSNPAKEGLARLTRKSEPPVSIQNSSGHIVAGTCRSVQETANSLILLVCPECNAYMGRQEIAWVTYP
jgi:hypothetical protein